MMCIHVKMGVSSVLDAWNLSSSGHSLNGSFLRLKKYAKGMGGFHRLRHSQTSRNGRRCDSTSNKVLWHRTETSGPRSSMVSHCVQVCTVLPWYMWINFPSASDACAVPVLTPEEAANLDASKSSLPIPHPQLSRTPSVTAHTAQTSSSVEKSLHLTPGSHTTDILRESGFSDQEVDVLLQDGALGNKRQAKLWISGRRYTGYLFYKIFSLYMILENIVLISWQKNDLKTQRSTSEFDFNELFMSCVYWDTTADVVDSAEGPKPNLMGLRSQLWWFHKDCQPCRCSSFSAICTRVL